VRTAWLGLVLCACAERPLPFPDELTAPQFVDEFAQAACARELRCGFLDAAELDTCQLYFSSSVEVRGTYHADAAQACLAQIDALDCLPLHNPFCDGVFTPTGQLGDPCDGDCAAGLACDTSVCPSVCVVSTAPEKGGLGAACDGQMTRLCANGLFCRPSDDTCALPGQLGDRCYATSGSYSACVEGLVCSGPEYPFGTCAPLVAEGGECFPLEPCGEGLRCMGVVSTQPAQPGHCRRPIPEGSACRIDEECRDFTVCKSGVCARPFRLLGELCNLQSDDCYIGYCSGGVCVPRLGLGAACDPDGSFKQCSTGICQPSTRTCTACR